ncbi:MAG: DUF1801 domain-containing protein [Acidobacteriota bacterium]
MTVQEYLDSLQPDRETIISRLHQLIMEHDKNVKVSVGRMMGKEMLVYNMPDGIFKYALSSVKTHMSFHSMVMYGSSERFCGTGLREKYEKLLSKAKFQKGCINFKNAAQMPLDIVEEFVKESAMQEYPPAIYKERMLKDQVKRRAAKAKKAQE